MDKNFVQVLVRDGSIYYSVFVERDSIKKNKDRLESNGLEVIRELGQDIKESDLVKKAQ